MLSTSLTLALGLVSTVNAWGGLGHKTVANVAMQYLQPDALTKVSAILAADPHKKGANPNLVSVASWADDWAHKAGGKFSKAFHYIDAKDDPPFACNVDFRRDCSGEEGCVVAAIANYTQQLIPPSSNPEFNADALKFLVHFIGDITQPLHAEDKARGGNDTPVKWNDRTKKLHGVWDSDIITKLIGPDNLANSDRWTDIIVNEIENGSYKELVDSWIQCTDPFQGLDCALAWARDSNALGCSYVWKSDPENKELSGTYYRGASTIVQEQVAKGGLRLAVWLNGIFGTPGEQLKRRQPTLVIQN